MNEKNAKHTKSVLVIQSASRALRPAVSWLQGQFDQPDIEVLVPGGASDQALFDEPRITRIDLDADGFHPGQISAEQQQTLRQNQYDLIVVLYNDVMDRHYGNVEDLARGINDRSVMGFDAKERTVKLEKPYRTYLVLKRFVFHIASTCFRWFYIGALIVIFVPGLIYRSIRNRLRPS